MTDITSEAQRNVCVKYRNSRSWTPTYNNVCKLTNIGWVEIYNSNTGYLEDNISSYMEVIDLTKIYTKRILGRPRNCSITIGNDNKTATFDHFEYAFLGHTYSDNPIEIIPILQYCHTTDKCRLLIYGFDCDISKNKVSLDRIEPLLDLDSISKIKMSDKMRNSVHNIIKLCN